MKKGVAAVRVARASRALVSASRRNNLMKSPRWRDAIANARDARVTQAAILAALGLLLIAGHFALKLVPIPPALLRPPIQSIALLDRNGIPLRESRVAERFSRELTLEEVPPRVIDAVLAAEDKRFFSHHGIDWLATGRALVAGITHGRIVDLWSLA